MNKRAARLSKVVTLVGAGIVLATFVVKDVMSERLKNLNDSLNSAESFYTSQTYSIFVQDDLSYLKQEIDTVLSSLEGKGKGQTEQLEELDSIRAQASDDHLAVLTEYLQNLATLVSKIPHSKTTANQVEELYGQCTQNWSNLKELRNESPALFAAINKNPGDPKAFQNLKDFETKSEKIAPETSTITTSATTLTKSIVTDLRTKERNSERDYSIATVVFYVLFGLGWLTSLAGQLLGVKTESV